MDATNDDVLRWFSADYVVARECFRDAAKRLGVEIDSRAIAARGPSEEQLTVDFCWVGPKNARKLILHSSGVHGVEGIPGSATQTMLLNQLHSGDLVLPSGVAIAFIHIVNPWGMAWLRRVNEDNADLNRNFLSKGEEYAGEPKHYERLNSLLNPHTAPGGFDPFLLKALWAIVTLGFSTAKQTVQEGQYERPKAMQYGGGKLAESSQHVLDWLEENLTEVERAISIDFHTGLGPFGVDSLLIFGDETRERLNRLSLAYGPTVMGNDPKTSVAYRIRGGIQGRFEADWPDIKWTTITQEFGTIKPIPLLKIARAENRLTQWGNKPPLSLLHSRERVKMLESFSPSSMKWRRMILNRGRALVDDAVKHLIATGADAQP